MKNMEVLGGRDGESRESGDGEREEGVAAQIYARIVQLNRERVELERGGAFLDAGRLKAHLTALGEEYKGAVLQAVRERQRAERDGLDAQYEEELRELGGGWEARLEQSEEEIRGAMGGAQEKQNEEIAAYEARLKAEMPVAGRMPPEVLNLQYQIERLVRDQRYTEAAQLQRQLEKARREAELRIHGKTEDKIKLLLENLIRRHETELLAAEARLNAERDALLGAREKDFEALHTKFRVFREKLEKNHAAELIREERALRAFRASSNLLAAEDAD